MPTKQTKEEKALISLMQDVLSKISKEAMEDSIWGAKSLYGKIKQIEIDWRGRAGERFFVKALTDHYINRIKIDYRAGDQGKWDLEVNGYRFEVKCASIGSKNPTFQFESIAKDVVNLEGVLFLGISPNALHIKFVRYADIPWDDLHHRGKAENATGAGYKWTMRTERPPRKNGNPLPKIKMPEMMEVNTVAEIADEFQSIFPQVFKKKKK